MAENLRPRQNCRYEQQPDASDKSIALSAGFHKYSKYGAAAKNPDGPGGLPAHFSPIQSMNCFRRSMTSTMAAFFNIAVIAERKTLIPLHFYPEAAISPAGTDPNVRPR